VARNNPPSTNENARFALGIVRGAGGAIVFALPLLMTMEMWQLGFTMDLRRLALLIVVLLPALALLSYHAGFEPTSSWRDDVFDAFVAYGIGFAASALVLWLLGILTSATSFSIALAQITVQTVPASIGAMLARSLLSGEHADEERPGSSYGGEVFIMAVGALFLAFSIAPTEEVLIITFRLSALGTIVLALVSLALMHAFVYAVEFRGQIQRAEYTTAMGEFLRLTVVGYAVSLFVCGYVLWTFGRADGLHPFEAARASVVLGFPAAIGAAAARLIL
jgi:putative integral membrane protein (TIGR02587 family)